MISVDSADRIGKRKGKGRLVRSLEFTSSTKPATTSSKSRQSRSKLPRAATSIWRDPLKPFLHPSGFTTHKMSSVTNNFMSSDLISSSVSDIDEMVGDLVDPGAGTLVFPQHDEVFRSSPLSTSSSFINDNEIEDEYTDDVIINPDNTPSIIHDASDASVGMSWNQKQNQWVPLIYRYVFPSSAFTVNTAAITTGNTNTAVKASSWSIKNGQVQPSQDQSRAVASFTFPPPKKSVMMAAAPAAIATTDGFLPNKRIDSDARDVCEKLLELMDDENLMLPVVKASPRASSPPVCSSTKLPAQPGKSLLSEWSSLPSSPPPPIFHDVCNRPIPELRLSPPMSGKSIGKRLFANISNTNPNSNTATTINNSNCESPLTKRLRFSSSSSSIS